MQLHNVDWLNYFARSGYPDTASLAAGMEGAVYRLRDGLVGKVWARRSAEELARLQRFYADIASADLPFATPEIHNVLYVDGTSVTFERELHGTPLQDQLSNNDAEASPAAMSAVVTVLRGLGSITATTNMRDLAVLDEPRPLWAGSADWPDTLVQLMARRVAAFGDQLRAVVNDFDAKYARLVGLLQGLGERPLTALHGDLCGVNILVDEALRPTAVLDFGFLSTAGDPAFDVSVAAAIFNMYGPHARQIDDQLTQTFADEFGYSTDLLLLYRAVYGVISSNAYDPAGQDGHFRWCAQILERHDVKVLFNK